MPSRRRPLPFSFVANLRPASVEAFGIANYTPEAWLLSTHRVTPQTMRLAQWVRESKTPLYADNGTKPLIDQVVDTFREDAAALRLELLALRRRTERWPPRPTDIPQRLRRKAATLARRVERSVDDHLSRRSVAEVIDEQLAMKPTHLFAQEDFAGACMMSLGLEREFTGWTIPDLNQRNLRTIRLWEETTADQRCAAIRVFVVLSALDYNTAKAAARMAAAAGADRVAIGIAGFNNDSSAITRFLIDRRYVDLPATPPSRIGAAPRKYVRLAQVLRGIRDGYRGSGVRLRAWHGLGLGAAAQFPVAAAAFDWYTEVTVDSTSPLMDAVNDLVFYDPANRGDRLTTRELVERELHGPRWSCPCPFCSSFFARRPHNLPEARAAAHALGGVVTADDMELSTPLGAALPLFATARGPEARDGTDTRTGHNHWTLDHIARSVPASRRVRWADRELTELAKAGSITTRRGIAAAALVLRS